LRILCRHFIESLGKAEVEDLYGTIGGDLDVCRFQVTMNDAAVMGSFNGFRDLPGITNCGFEWHWPRERFTLDILHDEEVRPHIVKAADVRVIQRGYRSRFSFKSFGELLVGDFDRDNAIQPGVARLVYSAHAAGADLRKNFIWAQPRSGIHWR
jgi:hypothetical protein